ncbi:MAG: hypothetical protein O3B75_09805 [Planctomycetota bacterium]|nr:hypothetical protein [Planctomycetota bacterium]
MPLTCNIDQRGRNMRIAIGAMIDGAGWILLICKFFGMIAGDWPWFVGTAAVIGGLFMIVEGVLGWCVVRGMGFKTPI